jgi:general stress protein 26
MKTRQGDAHKLKGKFWEAMDDSPFVFLQLDGDPESAVPMTAQLDEDADSAVWFFGHKHTSFAKLGPAIATFAGKDHEMFCRFKGELSIETSPERFDHFWNSKVAGWYDGGKGDPDMLFLRMDLAGAEIWKADMGLLNTAKMALGVSVQDEVAEEHVETTL